MGRSENPRATAARLRRHPASRQKHHSCRCSIATAWSSGAAVVRGGARRARLCLLDSAPTSCGAPITKASSCWAIASTVIPLPSPITPVAFCSLAKRFLPPGKTTLSPSLSGCFKNVACRLTSAATMGSLLHHPMLCSTSANLPSGGFTSALPLSASSLAILNTMAATNACISP